MVWKGKVEELLYVFKVEATDKTEEHISFSMYTSS